MLIGLVLVLVVGFFAYQWFARKRVSKARPAKAFAASVESGVGSSIIEQPAATAASMSTAPPKEERLPVVAGQSEAELRAKEPAQQRVPVSQQQPVMASGEGPANFDSNLRHPEQLFHQPAPAAPMGQVDVASGRAAAGSTPLDGHQQPFSPEFAQNGGALIGNTVFAYDGMEETGFTSF